MALQSSSYPVGTHFNVKLADNPSTGFTWYFVKDAATNDVFTAEDDAAAFAASPVVRFISRAHHQQGDVRHRLGAGGETVFSFEVVGPGSQTISLVRKRIWEPASAIHDYQMEVVGYVE